MFQIVYTINLKMFNFELFQYKTEKFLLCDKAVAFDQYQSAISSHNIYYYKMIKSTYICVSILYIKR